jgi:hypothetical protein
MIANRNYLIALTITAVAGIIFAEQGSDTVQPPQTSEKIDSATITAHDTSAQSATPAPVAAAKASAASSDSTDSAKSPEPILLIKSKKDTVIVITDEHNIHKIFQNVSCSVKKSRIQGYGGAGGFSNRLVAFNMDPVVDLVHMDAKLQGISFPSLKKGYKPLTMSGGLGYGGLGNGIRIGGGGYGGSCKYVSTPFPRNGTTPDSTVSLKVNIGYGGLLIEKALVKENWNIYLGSFIGGGGVEIRKVTSPVGKSSAFSDAWTDPTSGERARAAFMSTELHGGATYTIVPWMHIGGDVNALFSYSTSGFDLATSNSFSGFTPGIGFRVIFGNIG